MKFSNDYEDVEKVVIKLSEKDLLFICNGTFRRSPYTKYRLCLIIDNESIGFIEVYNLPDEEYEFIVIAISPKYRGKGYSYILLDKMFEEYNNRYPYLWRCDKDNNYSIFCSIKAKNNSLILKHNLESFGCFAQEGKSI